MKISKLHIVPTAVILVLVSLSGCATTELKKPTAEEENPIPGGGTAWTAEVDKSMKSLINPPENIPFFSGILLNIAEGEFEKELLPARILTWSTDLGLASGYLELYIEQGAAKILDPRLVYLLRMQVSYYVCCPFAIDVNAWKYKDFGITAREIRAMQGVVDLDSAGSFTEEELTALKYAVAMSRTPVSFEGKLLEDMRRLFSQEEITALGSLSAKVNYWARLIEAWRIKPAGYTDDPILNLEEFNSYRNSAGEELTE